MMLSRAALPSIRHRGLAAPVRLNIFNSQVRSYAKSRDKPKNDRPVRSFNVSNPIAAPEYISKSSNTKAQVNKDAQGQSATFKPSATTTATSSSHTTPHSREPSEPTVEPESDVPSQPSQPLPDLTKGIPSTFEAEFSQNQKSKIESEEKINITEDPQGPPPGPGGRGGGELPRSAYVSSSDRRRSALAKYVYSGLFLGLTGYFLYLGRNWDTEEEAKQNPEAPDGYTPGAMFHRMQARLGSTVSYYSDPVTTKLLPDEEADPNLRAPFVLVLSLEDMLVHSEWSRQAGYRIAKRPGVDYFIRYLSQYYELVLFTSQPSFVADQILRKLDPYSIIRWPLFREHTLYKDGGYVKDLSYLNRDLKKVVILDTDAHHVKNQPENAIVLPKWTGDPNDQSLIQLIPFLEYLATMGFDDARTVLKSFDGKYIPAEFAKRERLLREKYEKEQAASRKSRGGKGLGLGSLFGAKQQSPGGLNASEASLQGKMIWDQIREQGQKNYEAFEKRIREEGAKWLEEREAEEKRMQEEFSKSMKSGMFGWFGPKGAGEGGK